MREALAAWSFHLDVVSLIFFGEPPFPQEDESTEKE